MRKDIVDDEKVWIYIEGLYYRDSQLVNPFAFDISISRKDST